ASFPLRDEYYYLLRFRENDARFTPILKVALPGEAQPETVAWAVQREGGGRGFAYSGGHFHANWQDENLRRLVLNAVVWAARGRVPAGGVRSTVPSQGSPAGSGPESVDWPNVGNDKGAMRYSPLAQIRRDNVKDLQVAWTYHTGDASGTTIECTPVVVDGVMYVTTAHVQVAALDAATGRQLWRFN